MAPAPPPTVRPGPLARVPENACVDLDVRPIPRGGGEPFSHIMETDASVPAGHVLRLRATFKPAPLFAVMRVRGWSRWVERGTGTTGPSGSTGRTRAGEMRSPSTVALPVPRIVQDGAGVGGSGSRRGQGVTGPGESVHLGESAHEADRAMGGLPGPVREGTRSRGGA